MCFLTCRVNGQNTELLKSVKRRNTKLELTATELVEKYSSHLLSLVVNLAPLIRIQVQGGQ